MTGKDLMELIGRTGTLAVRQGSDALKFGVRVMGARKAFGRTDYQVQPLNGSGLSWVQGDSVKLHPQPVDLMG